MEAIRLKEKGGGKVVEVDNCLGIYPNILLIWMRKFSDDPAYSFSDNRNLRTPDGEIRFLKKRLREAEKE